MPFKFKIPKSNSIKKITNEMINGDYTRETFEYPTLIQQNTEEFARLYKAHRPFSNWDIYKHLKQEEKTIVAFVGEFGEVL